MDTKETKLDVRHSVTGHIILYAKGWYGRSGNILVDLQRLVEEVCALPKSDNTSNGKECLSRSFATCLPYMCEYDIFESIYEMIGWKWEGWNPMLTRTPEQVMIGKLAILSTEYILFCDGKPDDEILADIHFGKKEAEGSKE